MPKAEAGLYTNIIAKHERGEAPRKVGSKGAPTAKAAKKK